MTRIAALVLAAGRSQRMGAANKLLMEIDGAPTVARVVAAVLASKADPVLVVTGREADAVGPALADLGGRQGVPSGKEAAPGGRRRI